MDRFKTDNAYIRRYGDGFLVECPRCKKCARIHTSDEQGTPKVRLSCPKCGHAKDWQRKSHGIKYSRHSDHFEDGEVSIGAAVDWYFHLPLWLRIPCCGENLWAYNHEHLSWLKSYVSAKHRERTPHDKHGWANQSLASRLPKWIKQSGHRDALLSAIDKLEHKSDQC